MKKFIKNAYGLFLAAVLFGLFFPEFLLNSDTVRAYYIDETGKKIYVEDLDGRELYEELLQAENKDITIKSRLWENLKQFWKKD